jgi:DNA-binding IclR family transcriptional regulator
MSKDTASVGTVSALKRGIEVLHCFSGGSRSMSNGELSRMTGVPKATVARLTATLVALGLLRQDPETGKYALGAGVLSLAQAFLAGLDVREIARPHMAKLADVFGGSAYLGVCDGLEMVVIESSRARSSMLTLRLDVGSRLPMATSALGRAYLSALPAEERVRLIAKLKERNSADWPKLGQGVEAALRDAATLGYCASLGELRSEINSVATPILLPGGERIAMNCGGPAFAFSETKLRLEIAPRLLATAQTIAAEIGGSVQQRKVA